MLRDPSLGVDTKENPNVVKRSGEHLLALIDDVLDMSKIEAGGVDANPAASDLFELLTHLGIEYRYAEEKSAQNTEPAGAPALTVELLKELPATFIIEMRTAILDGDKSHLDVLIQTIGERDTLSARAVQQLADRYEYDALMQLLEEVVL